MKYSLEQQDAGIVIRIENARGQAKQFLDAVRNCEKAVRQGCAVGCGKMAAIEEASQGNTVVLRMVPRAGERTDIDVQRLRQRLQQKLKRVSKSPRTSAGHARGLRG